MAGRPESPLPLRELQARPPAHRPHGEVQNRNDVVDQQPIGTEMRLPAEQDQANKSSQKPNRFLKRMKKSCNCIGGCVIFTLDSLAGV